MSSTNRIREIIVEPSVIYEGDKIKVRARYLGHVVADEYTRYFLDGLSNITGVLPAKKVEYVESSENVDKYLITNPNGTTWNLSIPNGQMEVIDIEVNNNLEVVIRSSPNIKCYLDEDYILTVEF